MSGSSANKPTQLAYFFSATAMRLAMTPTVKAMESQRWVCRTHLFQFNGTSWDVGFFLRFPFQLEILFASLRERKQSKYNFLTSGSVSTVSCLRVCKYKPSNPETRIHD